MTAALTYLTRITRKGEIVMLGKTLLKLAPCCLAAFLVLAGAPAARAGGFHVSLELPASQTDARLKDAILIVRPGGCIDPTQAVLRVTAEGLVNGRRKSIPVKLTPAGPGVYGVNRQWPTEGTWILAIAGEARPTAGGAPIRCSRLVALGPEGQIQAERLPDARKMGNDLPAQTAYREFTAKEIDSALHRLASSTSKNQSATR
jgi:hypothetical protein